MRVVFVGTGRFGCPALQRVIASRHDVVSVVTKPDRRQGRGRRLSHSPVKQVALQGGVPVHQPADISSDDAVAHLCACCPDVLVVADFGQKLSDPVLAVPRKRAINLHASLLPKLRGAAPINWAILRGDHETGVTVIDVVHEMDAGLILDQQRLPIGPEQTSVELEDRLADLAADMIEPVLDRIEQGTVQGRAQDHASATRARRLRREDGRIDWDRSAQWICRRIRGLQPWPNARTFLSQQQATGPRALILKRARPAEAPPTPDTLAPGTVIDTGDQGILVRAGEGGVMITRLQPENGREMSADQFLRGHPLAPGDRLVCADA